MTALTNAKKFGEQVRALREARNIGLRKFAALVDMSPAYLSKIERDEFPPPAEVKVLTIAEVLDQDPDELLALAGRVASDLLKIIMQRPRETAALLRATSGLPSADVKRLTLRLSGSHGTASATSESAAPPRRRNVVVKTGPAISSGSIRKTSAAVVPPRHPVRPHV